MWVWITPAKVSVMVMNTIADVMIQKLHMLSCWLYGWRPRRLGMA